MVALRPNTRLRLNVWDPSFSIRSLPRPHCTHTYSTQPVPRRPGTISPNRYFVVDQLTSLPNTVPARRATTVSTERLASLVRHNIDHTPQQLPAIATTWNYRATTTPDQHRHHLEEQSPWVSCHSSVRLPPTSLRTVAGSSRPSAPLSPPPTLLLLLLPHKHTSNNNNYNSNSSVTLPTTTNRTSSGRSPLRHSA